MTLSATASASSRSSTSGRTTTNSSPPIRATRSSSRTWAWIRRLASMMSWSPAECPWVSFAFLSPSRSANSTAMRLRPRRPWASIMLMRTSSSRRLSSCVSGSCVAMNRSASRDSWASVTLTNWATRDRGRPSSSRSSADGRLRPHHGVVAADEPDLLASPTSTRPEITSSRIRRQIDLVGGMDQRAAGRARAASPARGRACGTGSALTSTNWASSSRMAMPVGADSMARRNRCSLRSSACQASTSECTSRQLPTLPITSPVLVDQRSGRDLEPPVAVVLAQVARLERHAASVVRRGRARCWTRSSVVGVDVVEDPRPDHLVRRPAEHGGDRRGDPLDDGVQVGAPHHVRRVLREQPVLRPATGPAPSPRRAGPSRRAPHRTARPSRRLGSA